MSDHAQTWHYGLVARYWAELNTDPGPEGDYYQSIIERFGQPALDVGCGTGRLLIPFREARLDVDGSDVSGDMLAHCRQKAEAAGLSVELYEQATHELELPRTYRTIIACGALGLGGDLDQAFEAIKRCYAHLEPGGVLAFDTELPWANAKFWSRWLKEGRQDLPDLWPPRAGSNLLDDGSDLRMSFRIVGGRPVDPGRDHAAAHAAVAKRRDDGGRGSQAHTSIALPTRDPHDARAGRVRPD